MTRLVKLAASAGLLLGTLLGVSAPAADAATPQGAHDPTVHTWTMSLTAQVTSRRNPSDSFTISFSSADGVVQGPASTGTSNSATVGPITLHRDRDDTDTLKEVATPGSGTNLSLYQISWSCTNHGKPYTVTPTAGNTAIVITLHNGDDINCTVTNSAPIVSGSLVTPEAGFGLAGVAGLVGLGWLVRRRRYRLA